MKFLPWLFLVSFCFYSSLSDAQTERQDSVIRLKILSWNIYMLPRFVKQTHKVTRARIIGQELPKLDYDLLVFQEAFHSGARKRIRKQLQKTYPYCAGPANQKSWSLKTNSGLWIFSKFPIQQSKAIIFSDRSGADAWARKGALFIEISVNGKPVQVVATHLQSSGPDAVRQSQYCALKDQLLDPFYRLGTPQIICGDFNISKTSHQYAQMIQSLDALDGHITTETEAITYDRLNNSLCDKESTQRELIDYILFKNNGLTTSTISRRIPELLYPWHSEHKYLSDHHPMEAICILK